MKKLDKQIIKILLSVIAILFIYNIIVNPQNALYIIGFIMVGISVAFVLANLCLCIPFLGIGMLLFAIYHKYIGSYIEHHFRILAGSLATVFVISGYLLIFFIWTYTMYMCLEYSTDWNNYLIFVDEMGD